MPNQFLKNLELAKAIGFQLVENSVLPSADEQLLPLQLYMVQYKYAAEKNAGPKHSMLHVWSTPISATEHLFSAFDWLGPCGKQQHAGFEPAACEALL